MKKVTILFMGLMLIFSLSACGSSQQSDNSTSVPGSEPTTEASSEPESTEDVAEISAQPKETESGKTLVVYYSATGNTESAANYIAEATSSDMFELEPVEPYSVDELNYNDDGSRVVYEYDNPDAREVELVATTVDNWDEYDTVFIGYPIWWGIAAWPVDGFIEANDFTGKTVIPFATSASSGFGKSGKLLAEVAGTGNWLEGARFSSSVSKEDIQTWITGLGW